MNPTAVAWTCSHGHIPRAVKLTCPALHSSVRHSFTSYEETFRIMTYRRLQRELMGTYSKQRKWPVFFWVLVFVALEGALVTVTNSKGLLMIVEVRINVLANLLGTLLLVVILYVVLQVVTVLRWCLLWIACGSIVALILAPNEHLRIYQADKWTSGQLTSVIGCITAGACLLNILLWYHYNKVRESVARCSPFALNADISSSRRCSGVPEGRERQMDVLETIDMVLQD